MDNQTQVDSGARLEPASTGQPPLQDLREKHFRIPGVRDNLRLFLRYMPPADASLKAIVLYVHGATFPSALSIAHRFDGRSWRNELCAAGFDVWGLDFQGFGGSDRYPEMSAPAEQSPALGRAQEASQQVELAVRFIASFHKVQTISLIAHSWASMAVGHFAGRCPDLVDRIVFFAPISMRTAGMSSPSSAQDEKSPYPLAPGAWLRSKRNGTDLPKTSHLDIRRCWFRGISLNGASCIWILTLKAGYVCLPALKFRPVQFRISPMLGKGTCLMTPA